MKRKPAQNSKRTAKRRGKPRGKPFKPGESGNPGGRPKLPEEVRQALELMRGPLTLKAIETLERNMESNDGFVSNAAANIWLKKTLPDEALKLDVSLSGPDGQPIQSESKVVVENDESPQRLARVLAVLRGAGALPAAGLERAAGDAAAAEDDAMDSAGAD